MKKKILISIFVFIISLFIFNKNVFAFTNIATYKYSSTDFDITLDNGLTEEVIYNNFITFNSLSNLNYNFADFPYIIVRQNKYNNRLRLDYTYLYSTCPLTANFTYSWSLKVDTTSSCQVLDFRYNSYVNPNSYSLTIREFNNENVSLGGGNTNNLFATTPLNIYTGTPNNILDFSDYLSSFPSSFTYNDNYLDDNSNFQKVCVNNQNTTFSVIPNDLSGSATHSPVENFIISPTIVNNLDIGFIGFNADNSRFEYNYDLDFLYQYDLINPQEIYYLDKNNPQIGIFKSMYNDLYYNLYGYSIILNRYQKFYPSDEFDYAFQVFKTNNTYGRKVGYTDYSDCFVENDLVWCNHAGGGRTHDTEVNITEDTCFYIPNNYHLHIWGTDAFGDIDDTININDTDFTIKTDDIQNDYINNLNNTSYSGFIGYFQTLVSRLKIPINFILTKITMFFNFLPENLRYLVISIISIGFLWGIIKLLFSGK